MYKNIDVTELLQKITEITLVDLRSPAEYLEATIPGSHNIPLFDNVERALVGTVYRHQGITRAKELAVDIVAPKLPNLMKSLGEIARHKEIIIFCWRGGSRSHFVGSLLDVMGYKTYRLIGGYKAFRKHDYMYLQQDSLAHQTVVLHGLTGVGKTDVLLALKKHGWPVLDLEDLARHRGSVFGKIGQQNSPSQKYFDSLVAKELRNSEQQGLLILECEGKKIGHLYVPTAVVQMANRSINILLYADLENRVRRIKRDYLTDENQNYLLLHQAITRLTQYIGKNKVDLLNQWLDQNKIADVIKYLLVEYYDPLYHYPGTPSAEFNLSVCNNDLQQSVPQIIKLLKGL